VIEDLRRAALFCQQYNNRNAPEHCSILMVSMGHLRPVIANVLLLKSSVKTVLEGYLWAALKN
jgi:hypothetical protein